MDGHLSKALILGPKLGHYLVLMASACFGEKIETISQYYSDYSKCYCFEFESNSIKPICVGMESIETFSEDVRIWYHYLIDAFLAQLPRYDRMERKKHLESLIDHWINFKKMEGNNGSSLQN